MRIYQTAFLRILIVCLVLAVTVSSGFTQIRGTPTPPPTPTPTPTPTPSAQNETRLLFPFATSTNGFDTGIIISNTGKDSTGTIGVSGTATIYFFGDGAPASFTTPSIAPGGSYANVMSSLAPGFQGYVEVVCNFPFAHGWGFLSDVGARNLAATIPALVLPIQRTNTSTESLGQ